MTAAWRGLQAAALLAVALKQHPHSPGLLLSLTALHTLLGNGERATATFLEASPRSVQLDALAHHITPSLAEMPSPKQKTMLRMACTPQALPRRPFPLHDVVHTRTSCADHVCINHVSVIFHRRTHDHPVVGWRLSSPLHGGTGRCQWGVVVSRRGGSARLHSTGAAREYGASGCRCFPSVVRMRAPSPRRWRRAMSAARTAKCLSLANSSGEADTR